MSCIAQSVHDLDAAAKMSQLKQLIGHGMSLGIDVCYEVILCLSAHYHFCVVVKEIHLHNKNNLTFTTTWSIHCLLLLCLFLYAIT